MLKRLISLVITLSLAYNAYSQDIDWPSPEVEQMYHQGKESLARGAIQQAVNTFQQAVALAPNIVLLRRELANALIIEKNYDRALKVVEPIIEKNQADEMTYHIAANALMNLDEKKKAKSMLEKGIAAYPNSGMLYNELGDYYEAKNDMEFALDSWLDGIEKAPNYYLNYYKAAKAYSGTDKKIWTILYGEIFLNLERETSRSTEIEKLLLDAYSSIYNNTSGITFPKYGENVTQGEEHSFEAAVMQTLQDLSPVVSDGITTDNLIMLRARFIIQWMNTFAAKYPYALFNYQEKMMGDGVFDAYNQFLFGTVENENQYKSWKEFHTKAIPAFNNWVTNNPFKLNTGEFYNNKDLRDLFTKRKKH